MTGKMKKLIRALNGLPVGAALSLVTHILRTHATGAPDVDGLVDFDERGYTRRVLSESRVYRLLVLCWRCGQMSPIHDHGRSACGVRVIQGVATETSYERIGASLARPTGAARFLPAGTVFGGNGGDIHALGNLQSDGTDLITLHVYSPPLELGDMVIFQEPEGAFAAPNR